MTNKLRECSAAWLERKRENDPRKNTEGGGAIHIFKENKWAISWIEYRYSGGAISCQYFKEKQRLSPSGISHSIGTLLHKVASASKIGISLVAIKAFFGRSYSVFSKYSITGFWRFENSRHKIQIKQLRLLYRHIDSIFLKMRGVCQPTQIWRRLFPQLWK